MDGIAPISSDFLDENGNVINIGDLILYKDNTFIVMNDDKGPNSWIAHPSLNNNMKEDLLLEEIHAESRIV